MSDDQLDRIESALGVTLPPAYRRVSRAFPFRPIGRDWVYWFYDDPGAVIDETLHPMEDGDYSGPALLPRYVVIGQSAAGDAYLLDLAGDGLPVACLSHETHAVEPEWPTFEAFVEEWKRAPAEAERRAAADRAVRRAWWRRYWLITGFIALFGIVLPLLVLWLAR